MFNNISKHYPPFLELIPFCCLIFAWFYAIGQYPHLPASIPTHFGFDGSADAWSDKGFLSVYLLPLITTVVYIMDFSINIAIMNSKDPRKFVNLPIDKNAIVDEKTIEVIRTNTARFMYIINLLVTGFLTYINYGAIQAGLGSTKGINSFLSIFFIAALLIITILFTVKIMKLQKEALAKK